MKNFYGKKYIADRFEGPKSLSFSLWKFLKKRRAKKILDVGCGSGWLMRYLKEKGFKVIGCDNSSYAVKVSGAVEGKATSLPFKDESFDAVLGISIIEHLIPKDAHEFLNEAYRVLKKGGVLFLVTPNYATPLRLILGKKWGGYADPTHLNFYTPNSLKKMLQGHSFSNFQATFDYDPDIPFDFGFPPFFYSLPASIKNLINFLIISTPFYYLRHSFWLATRKK